MGHDMYTSSDRAETPLPQPGLPQSPVVRDVRRAELNSLTQAAQQKQRTRYVCLSHLSCNRPLQQPTAKPLSPHAQHEEDGVGEECDQHRLFPRSCVREHLDSDALAGAMFAPAATRGRGREAVLRWAPPAHTATKRGNVSESSLSSPKDLPAEASGGRGGQGAKGTHSTHFSFSLSAPPNLLVERPFNHGLTLRALRTQLQYGSNRMVQTLSVGSLFHMKETTAAVRGLMTKILARIRAVLCMYDFSCKGGRKELRWLHRYD